jgi:hypothetical protein
MIHDRLTILNNLINRNEYERDRVKEDEKLKFPFIIVEFPELKTNQNVR